MLITTAAEFRALNAETPVVGIGFFPKPAGLLHEGHQHLIQQAKTLGPVCCNLFDATQFKILLGDSTATAPDYDLQYMVDTLTSFGADHVWVPGDGIAAELRPANGWNNAIQLVNQVATNRGYDILDPATLVHLKFFMLTSYLLRNGHPGPWLKMESNKEGLYSFIKKDFWEQYIGGGFTLIDPLERPDGLVHGSNLLIRPEREITRLVNIVNGIRSRAEDLTDPVVRQQLREHINRLKDNDRWDFVDVKVHRGGHLPAGVVYITLIIDADYNCRFRYKFKL
jgi:hypothetical protein